MNERFINEELGTILEINDAEVRIQHNKDPKLTWRFPYGSIRKMKLGGLMGSLDIYGNDNGTYTMFFFADKDDKKRIKAMLPELEERNRKAKPCAPIIEKEKGKEYRVKCNVCGNVFCYSDSDLQNNERLAQKAAAERRMAVTSALGTTIIESNQHTQAAERYESQIVNFKKCPKCHSADLTEMTEDEFKEAQKAAASSPTAAPSAADEIKKFKELLDLGAISQEEFDAKKKQLLGL